MNQLANKRMAWSELLLILLIATIVLGPERMLQCCKKAGIIAGKLRQQFHNIIN